MKKSKLPRTDSIEKLARFWDSHDLEDFEDELEEVTEPAFVRSSAFQVRLGSRDAQVVEKLARAKGVSGEQLIRTWVLQKLAGRKQPRRQKR